ncbi:hypothetical protein LSA36186_26030 [Lachnoanaerobaculum sp. JCM 36186]|nr:hypothetical protein LSA36186_26030 [Lachnoanaerobaculum sp. JCM 36186]
MDEPAAVAPERKLSQGRTQSVHLALDLGNINRLVKRGTGRCSSCLSMANTRVKRRTLVGVKGQTAPTLGEPSENTFFTE